MAAIGQPNLQPAPKGPSALAPQKGKTTKVMDSKTERLVFLLILTILSSLLFNVGYKPQRSQLMGLEQELESVKNRVAEFEVQFPDLSREENILAEERKALEIVRTQLKNKEDQLPQKNSLPGLLTELLRQSFGYDVDFQLIKPLDDKKETDYHRLKIKMQFAANYENFVKYFYRLENIFEFMAATNVVIDETKEPKDTQLNIAMELTTLLAEELKGKPMAKVIDAATEIQPIKVDIDPFKQKFSRKETAVLKKDDYHLSGIISRGDTPTAIINDEVYKIGDKIGNSQIKKIAPHSVTLQDDKETIELTIRDE